jgi:deazaflavin-dependent oxidoreductase (nitroreductase family)
MEMTHRLDRWLYRGKRPHLTARVLNGAWARLAGAGFGPQALVRLDVTGRRSGRTVSLPVVVADYQGERYLVSMLGQDANWVRNVRAAHGQAVLCHRYREPVELEEVPLDERAPILRRYLECAPGARKQITVDSRSPLEDLHAAAQNIPVFRIRSRTPSPTVAGGEPLLS